jgi:hypothetical protein
MRIVRKRRRQGMRCIRIGVAVIIVLAFLAIQSPQW